MKLKNQSYDVCVIGGGAAGILSAVISSRQGKKVIIIEKNKELGKKLLLTGGGRCNFTNLNYDPEKLGKNGKFLISANQKFDINNILEFFKEIGIDYKVESTDKVFPQSSESQEFLEKLQKALQKEKVTILYKEEVKNIEKKAKKIHSIITDNYQIEAKKFIFAVGGKSYPQTGSNGESFKLIEKMGHTFTDLKPALTPILLKNQWISYLKGISFNNIVISFYKDNKKQFENYGAVLFTHFGISGPAILNLSMKLCEVKDFDNSYLSLDLKPKLDFKTLDKKILKELQKNANKQFRNSLNNLMPPKIIPTIIKLSGINPDIKTNAVTKEERKKIVHLLKGLKLYINELANFDTAVITKGGVSLKEIDPKTMRSKIIDNLYFAGEMLDLQGPTGGYNLTIAWQTAFIAAQ